MRSSSKSKLIVYLEAIHSSTLRERKAKVAKQLLAYRVLNTFALLLLRQFLARCRDMKFKGN